MGLPYITEAYVLAAPHHEARELPAAIVRLTDTNKSMDNSEITLQRIRDDLYATTAAYKLPALLRVLQNGEVIPRSPTDKPIKRGLLKLYFDISTFVPPDYSVPGVEYWGNRLDQVESKTRPWDWCGLQRGD